MAQTFTEFSESAKSNQPHYLVIGHPIDHSLSPLMHNKALTYHNIDAKYHAVNLRPDELTSFISWVNRDQFLGCNITIPYKQQLFEIVDDLDENAARAGAINTISKTHANILVGSNTDIFGFTNPLLPYSSEIEDMRAIVFGTGGASKAVHIALEELGVAEIIYVSRNPSGEIDNVNGTFTKSVGYDQWQAFTDDATLIVNTTPLGMGNFSNKSIIDDSDIDLLAKKICYDLIYNPLETKFLKQAKSAGAEVISGLEMFIQQGRKSFQTWTNKNFPVDEIRSLLREELQS